MTIPIKTLHKYHFYSCYDLGVMKEFFNTKSNISAYIVRGQKSRDTTANYLVDWIHYKKSITYLI